MNQKILALLALLAIISPPAFGEQDGDVTIKRNPDGTIETSDSGSGSDSEAVPSSTGGTRRIPIPAYQKKTSDGIHFKRNADGSIETWEDEEPMPHSSGGSSGKTKKKTTVKKSTTQKSVPQKAITQKATTQKVVVKKKTN